MCLVLVSLATTTPALATQFVIPGSLASSEGNSSTTSGIVGSTAAGSGAVTVQIQITAAELSALGLNAGNQITGVRTRLNAGEVTGPASPIAVTDLEITMARAANAIGSMSTSFSFNVLSPVLVRDGAYTLPANSMPGGSTPNAFGPLISFDTAYTYQGGDLIFMYTRPAATILVSDFATSYTGAGTAYRSASDNNYHATSGGVTPNIGVFQFEVLIPEPTSLALLGVGSACLLGRRRRAD